MYICIYRYIYLYLYLHLNDILLNTSDLNAVIR